VASNKHVVERYIDGFRRGDDEAILSCVTDDVVWVLHGYRTLRGRDAFRAELSNDAAAGPPTLHLDRLVEEGDTVAATGRGQMTLNGAGPVNFVFAEVFTFADGMIRTLETFHVNVSDTGDNLWTAPQD
jgi:ketosteroid isomerase-like protein